MAINSLRAVLALTNNGNMTLSCHGTLIILMTIDLIWHVLWHVCEKVTLLREMTKVLAELHLQQHKGRSLQSHAETIRGLSLHSSLCEYLLYMCWAFKDKRRNGYNHRAITIKCLSSHLSGYSVTTHLMWRGVVLCQWTSWQQCQTQHGRPRVWGGARARADASQYWFHEREHKCHKRTAMMSQVSVRSRAQFVMSQLYQGGC